jgi:dipeptidyl aminopeptidase/acylaminoacyl peptidase
MTQPFRPEDISLFKDLGQLNASAANGLAACVVRTLDLQNDGYLSTIWTFALDGSGARAFTSLEHADNSPAWSPDGKTLAFVSARGSAPQVHLIAADGGEARALTRLPHGASAFAWSPDGKRLLVASALPVDIESREERRIAEQLPPVHAPQLAWRIPYKADGSGYTLASTFQLFVVDAATGDAQPLAHGPTDVLAQGWSPDGKRIVHTRGRSGRESHLSDVWIVDVDGGDLRQLTSTFATTLSPRWSPDGRWIAFSGAREDGDAQTRLYALELASGRVQMVGDDDLEVASPDAVHWSAASDAVLLVAARRARQHIVRVGLHDNRITPLVEGDRHIAEFCIAGGQLVYTAENAAEPRELYACDPQGQGARQLSFLNSWWGERTPLVAEMRSFDVPREDGGRETIEGWLVHAKDGDGPRPLMMEAHGGPNSFALLGYPWNTYWNVLCSAGWAVVVPHAVGSTSFGREFAERLNGHWGERDFPQFMAVLDALQADGTASDVAVIAGKSYGGYMSAWAIGHTNRFKAAIVAAPVANLESHAGTSDGGPHGQPYVLKAERHIDPERYRALSPVNFAHNAVTPTLLLQGERDERCPRGQSEELFAVLQRVGKAPAELVIYPEGDHHLYETGRPSHRLDVVRRMMDWIARWSGKRTIA